jgi:tyrosyl-tRNA synthetase
LALIWLVAGVSSPGAAAGLASCEGPRAPAERVRESSIGRVTDGRSKDAPEAAKDVVGGLLAGAVDVLPEGQLERQLAEGKPLRVKFGVDPTSPDIHLGHCVVLNKLRAFQDAGHTVVLIIGDFTARVGDPSGRDETRPVLDADEIEANARTYQEQAFTVLDRERTELGRNSEWLAMDSEELFALLRRFTVARLLEREDFARRIEAGEGISILELVYPVLQGYDSVVVKADVELGATDQKFNLLFARDVQEAFAMAGQTVMTMPILVGTDGVRKMSKTYGNYVGVTDPPEEMFGKLMSIPDEAMEEYYVLLLGERPEPDRHPGEAKRELARRLTDRFHGEGAGEAAEARFDRIHVRGEIPEDMPDADLREFVGPGADGTVHVPALIGGVFDLSTSEARRLLQQGGVKLDGETVGAEPLDRPIDELNGRVLQVGKRRFVRLVAG